MQKQTITEIWARRHSSLLRAFYVYCFWGEQRELDQFIQAYAIEKARIEAHKRGHTVTEQSLADGSIKLTVQIGGVA